MPNGSVVVANAFTTGLATFYNRSGHVLQTITVPGSASEPPGSVGHPTGVVYNPTKNFVISANDVIDACAKLPRVDLDAITVPCLP